MTTADETLYVAFSTHVYALDLANGDMRWRFPTQLDAPAPAQFYAPPGVTADTVIVGSYGTPGSPELLIGIDRASGAERWRIARATDDEANTFVIGGITTRDQVAYVASTDHQLYTLDYATNVITGTQATAPTLVPVFSEAQNALWAAPVLDGGTIYQASLDHRLYAISGTTKRWEFQAEGALAGSPALADGVLYFGDFSSKVYAVDAQTGQARWSAPVAVDNWVWGTPAVANGAVYVTTLGGKVYAFDAASGQPKWANPAQVGGPVRGSPALNGARDTLYVGAADGNLYALDAANGAQRWIGPTAPSAHIYADAHVVNESVIIAVNNAPSDNPAIVYAFDAASGAVRWKFTPPPP
jgi:outer membrane protein assembly factor BamB